MNNNKFDNHKWPPGKILVVTMKQVVFSGGGAPLIH